LQLSLFDRRDMAAITSPDYPGERLIVCRNGELAAERCRKRLDLLAATERDLAVIAVARARQPLRCKDQIGLKVGAVVPRGDFACPDREGRRPCRHAGYIHGPAPDGDTVEVAHEALFREWARLKSWLEPERGASGGAEIAPGRRRQLGAQLQEHGLSQSSRQAAGAAAQIMLSG
jgi:hypothetical protein